MRGAIGQLFIIGLLFGSLGFAQAEERALPVGNMPALLLTSFLSASSQTTFSLANAEARAARQPGEFFLAGDEMTLEPYFLRYANEKRGSSDDSVVLLRKRLPSRFAYDSWARLQTGYGELFPGDTIGRSRTNGVGIEDPHCLYFKMTLRF